MRSPDSRPIRILIVEDHLVVADALAALLDEQPDMDVIGSVGSVKASISMAAQFKPDVVILDFSLSDGTGADAAIGMQAVDPEAELIFLTRHDSDSVHFAAVAAGASAFIHKSRAAADIISAVRSVAEGGTQIDASTIATLLRRQNAVATQIQTVSAREKAVLRLMAEGAPSRAIAATLGISYSTVRSHMRHLSSKLGARSKIETIVKARKLGLVD